MQNTSSLLPNIDRSTLLHELTRAQINSLEPWFREIHEIVECDTLHSIINSANQWDKTLGEWINDETAIALQDGSKAVGIEAAREVLAEHGIEISSSLEVRVKTGKPTTFPDGTKWDGWENVGTYETEQEAIAAAIECAKDRNNGHL